MRNKVSSVSVRHSLYISAIHIFKLSLRRNLEVLIELRPEFVNCCFSSISVSSSELPTEVCKGLLYQAEPRVLYPYRHKTATVPTAGPTFLFHDVDSYYTQILCLEKLCGTRSFQNLEGDVSNLKKKKKKREEGVAGKQTHLKYFWLAVVLLAFNRTWTNIGINVPFIGFLI